MRENAVLTHNLYTNTDVDSANPRFGIWATQDPNTSAYEANLDGTNESSIFTRSGSDDGSWFDAAGDERDTIAVGAHNEASVSNEWPGDLMFIGVFDHVWGTGAESDIDTAMSNRYGI